uniref:Uncharacterized protein n=1 Tax=Sphaerodactylus townsendi TaxID=933632 RepID=A0ACB8E797_9SAUR
MEVSEQLETLSVAGDEGSCSGVEGRLSLSSEDFPETASEGLSGAGPGGLFEAGKMPVPDGAAIDGPSSSSLQLSATDPSHTSGSAFSRNCTWPSDNPGAVSAAGEESDAGRSEEQCQHPQAPAPGERLPGLGPCHEEGPPPPLDFGRPGALSHQFISPGTQEQDLRVQSFCDVFPVEKEQLIDEGEGGISSVGSESDSDTDSSSVSSTSSCSPVLSEEDGRQFKNDENSHSIGKKDDASEKSLPVEDLKIFLPESVELMPFGKVSSIIENLVIVESLKGLPPVNENSVIFKQDRHSIGKVFEVFGPVSHPFYVIQFNSPEHIDAKDIKVHEDVYFAPSVESFTQYIFPEKIKQDKGSDASWKNDEEPPPEASTYFL